MRARIGTFALRCSALTMFAMLWSGNALAATVVVEEVPTSVRVEKYPTSVVLWRLSGSWPQSSCSYLSLATGSSESNHRLLFQSVTAAKILGVPVMFVYDSATCVLTSHGMS